MKVIDFKGNKHTWPPRGHVTMNDETRPRSALHLTVRNVLKSKYPLDIIMEEVPLPGTRLVLDFYLPRANIAVECQGKQHIEQTNFFHKDKLGFINSQVRDRQKADWCELNNIKLITVYYDQNPEDLI